MSQQVPKGLICRYSGDSRRARDRKWHLVRFRFAVAIAVAIAVATATAAAGNSYRHVDTVSFFESSCRHRLIPPTDAMDDVAALPVLFR